MTGIRSSGAALLPPGKTRASTFATVFLFFICGWSVARAHDPMDITAQARVAPEGIELRVTLAWSTAVRLLHDGQPASPSAPPPRPDRFDELRPRFLIRAPGFLTVATGGKTLVPKTVAVDLTEDHDVKILLRFPPTRAARFRFEAPFLRTLPYGYSVFLLARGPREDQVVREQLTREQPGCDAPAFSP